MSATLLCSAYMPPIHFFTAMARSGEVVIEQYDSYSKQTWRNRCMIAVESGVQSLTVPVVRGNSKQLMRDVRISDHGNWRRLHWNALKTAYMNSPFFIYYTDDLYPFFERRWEFLIDFNTEITEKILELIDIKVNIRLTDRYLKLPDMVDLRHFIDPSVSPRQSVGEYWQVFKSENGFIGGLSILDLLFNTGPEAKLLLTDAGNDIKAGAPDMPVP